MAKFRDLSQSYKNDDRSIGDRQRHINFIKEQLRADLPSFLEEINIFRNDEKNSNNIQKITLKMAKEFRFAYEKKPQQEANKGGIGQSKTVQDGDVVGTGEESGKKGSGDIEILDPQKGGRESGKLIIELSPEEIDDILDDSAKDLNLPFLSPKKTNATEVTTQGRWRGLKENGIEPRLDLEASYIERIKREQITKKRKGGSGQSSYQTKFISDDLRYHGISVRKYPKTKVVIFFIMDTSGSMDKKKKYYAKAFCYALYNFILSKYLNAELVFIAHDTEAREVDGELFFKLSSDGGTSISSGPLKALKIISEKFDPELWDIYCVHCSDGENNSDDETYVVPAFKKLVEVSKLVGFLEIKPEVSANIFVPSSSISKELTGNIKNNNFKVMFISKKNEIRESFDEFLSINKEGS